MRQAIRKALPQAWQDEIKSSRFILVAHGASEFEAKVLVAHANDPKALEKMRETDTALASATLYRVDESKREG